MQIFVLIFSMILGLALRLYAASFGNNVDLDSWLTAANIVNANTCTVYQCTPYYNYGPVWFEILGLIQKANLLLGFDGFDSFRFSVALFLSIVDLLIITTLYSQFNLYSAILYALNPVAIIITGYHSQFDNLAILIALISILIFIKGKIYIGLVILGLSLSTKHIFFLFPVWLFFKYMDKKFAFKLLVIPYIVFIFGFLFYIKIDNFFHYVNGNELSAIIKNVFMYRSGQNGIIWAKILSQAMALKLQFYLFVVSLTIFGYLLRKRNLMELFASYLVLVVILSSGSANQYLTIPVVSISIYPNIMYLFYSLYAAAFLLVDDAGLHLNSIRALLSWNGANGLNNSIMILIVGFLMNFLKNLKANGNNRKNK